MQCVNVNARYHYTTYLTLCHTAYLTSCHTAYFMTCHTAYLTSCHTAYLTSYHTAYLMTCNTAYLMMYHTTYLTTCQTPTYGIRGTMQCCNHGSSGFRVSWLCLLFLMEGKHYHGSISLSTPYFNPWANFALFTAGNYLALSVLFWLQYWVLVSTAQAGKAASIGCVNWKDGA